MAIVYCSIEETSLTNENGYDVDGVVATCSKCGNTTESFGVSDESIRRCLAMMREECLRGEKNFYKAEPSI